jgi:hypothetical protein
MMFKVDSRNKSVRNRLVLVVLYNMDNKNPAYERTEACNEFVSNTVRVAPRNNLHCGRLSSIR